MFWWRLIGSRAALASMLAISGTQGTQGPQKSDPPALSCSALPVLA